MLEDHRGTTSASQVLCESVEACGVVSCGSSSGGMFPSLLVRRYVSTIADGVQCGCRPLHGNSDFVCRLPDGRLSPMRLWSSMGQHPKHAPRELGHDQSPSTCVLHPVYVYDISLSLLESLADLAGAIQFR